MEAYNYYAPLPPLFGDVPYQTEFDLYNFHSSAAVEAEDPENQDPLHISHSDIIIPTDVDSTVLAEQQYFDSSPSEEKLDIDFWFVKDPEEQSVGVNPTGPDPAYFNPTTSERLGDVDIEIDSLEFREDQQVYAGPVESEITKQVKDTSTSIKKKSNKRTRDDNPADSGPRKSKRTHFCRTGGHPAEDIGRFIYRTRCRNEKFSECLLLLIKQHEALIEIMGEGAKVLKLQRKEVEAVKRELVGLEVLGATHKIESVYHRGTSFTKGLRMLWGCASVVREVYGGLVACNRFRGS